MKCLKKLVDIDRDWVPHSTSSTLYIRPTLIGTEVRDRSIAALRGARLSVLHCAVQVCSRGATLIRSEILKRTEQLRPCLQHRVQYPAHPDQL